MPKVTQVNTSQGPIPLVEITLGEQLPTDLCIVCGTPYRVKRVRQPIADWLSPVRNLPIETLYYEWHEHTDYTCPQCGIQHGTTEFRERAYSHELPFMIHNRMRQDLSDGHQCEDGPDYRPVEVYDD